MLFTEKKTGKYGNSLNNKSSKIAENMLCRDQLKNAYILKIVNILFYPMKIRKNNMNHKSMEHHWHNDVNIDLHFTTSEISN